MLTPFYEEDGITIYHADCREVLPTLSPESIDILITDPPYAEQTHRGARARKTRKGRVQTLVNFASTHPELLREIFRLCAPLTKRWLISTMDWHHLSYLETNPPEGWQFIRFGIWIKPNGAPQFTGDRPATGWEAVGIFHKTNARKFWNGGGRHAVWTYQAIKGAPHPTQKPLPLIQAWIDLFGAHGTILDPFMGSGTTLLAAKERQLPAIGIDIDERNCEIAATRLSQGVLVLEFAN